MIVYRLNDYLIHFELGLGTNIFEINMTGPGFIKNGIIGPANIATYIFNGIKRMGYTILIINPLTDLSYDGSKLVSLPIAGKIPPARYGLATAKDNVPRRIVQVFIELCRLTLNKKAAAAGYFLP